MIIRMRHYISGGRADGTDWPDAHVPFEVGDQEGFDLIRGGNAYAHDSEAAAMYERMLRGEPARPEHVTAPAPVREEPAVTAEQPVMSLPAATAAGPVPDAASREAEAAAEAPETPAGAHAGGMPEEPAGTAAEPDAVAAGTPAEAPGPSAPKPAWIAWAVSRGATPEEAGAMTKADLMSRYGGRL